MATAAQNRTNRSSKRLSHRYLVDLLVKSESLLSESKEISESWRRCPVDYHVDVGSRSAPHIMTEARALHD